MTEYTLPQESDINSSAGGSTAAVQVGDFIGIFQTSSGRLKRVSVACLFGANSSTAASQLGSATGLWAVYGGTATSQPVGAAQAAIISTAATSTTPFGYATSTQANGVVSLVNAIQAALVAVGIMKGGA